MYFSVDPIAAGVMSARDIEALRQVFDPIVHEIWFSQCPEKQVLFAQLVMDLYRRGVRDPHKLLATCTEIARTRFCDRSLVPIPKIANDDRRPDIGGELAAIWPAMALSAG